MTDNKKHYFAESKKLNDIICRSDWRLYDVTKSKKYSFSWDELETQSPAEKFEIGHNYFFAPNPKVGQTKRDAYAVTKGIGPAIVVDSLDDHVDMDGEAPLVRGSRLIYGFSRLVFDTSYVVGMSPPSYEFPNVRSPIIVIPYRSVTRKFEKLFRIVTPTDIGVDPEEIKRAKCLPTPKSDPEKN